MIPVVAKILYSSLKIGTFVLMSATAKVNTSICFKFWKSRTAGKTSDFSYLCFWRRNSSTLKGNYWTTVAATKFEAYWPYPRKPCKDSYNSSTPEPNTLDFRAASISKGVVDMHPRVAYEKMREAVTQIDEGSGVLIMVDMGSLATFDSYNSSTPEPNTLDFRAASISKGVVTISSVQTSIP
jgi:hypothetical protein